jgi:hypothetical protein
MSKGCRIASASMNPSGDGHRQSRELQAIQEALTAPAASWRGGGILKKVDLMPQAERRLTEPTGSCPWCGGHPPRPVASSKGFDRTLENIHQISGEAADFPRKDLKVLRPRWVPRHPSGDRRELDGSSPSRPNRRSRSHETALALLLWLLLLMSGCASRLAPDGSPRAICSSPPSRGPTSPGGAPRLVEIRFQRPEALKKGGTWTSSDGLAQRMALQVASASLWPLGGIPVPGAAGRFRPTDIFYTLFDQDPSSVARQPLPAP